MDELHRQITLCAFLAATVAYLLLSMAWPLLHKAGLFEALSQVTSLRLERLYLGNSELVTSLTHGFVHCDASHPSCGAKRRRGRLWASGRDTRIGKGALRLKRHGRAKETFANPRNAPSRLQDTEPLAEHLLSPRDVAHGIVGQDGIKGIRGERQAAARVCLLKMSQCIEFL
jgi:hypothetical protein